MKRPLFFVLFPAALLLTACSFSLAEDITPPPGSQQQPFSETQTPVASGPLYPLVAPNPADGDSIYLDKCAPCHGPTGQGDGAQASQLPNAPSPLGSPEVARRSTPADWYKIVTRGDLGRFMPPFPSLSERQRWDVIAYAYSLSASQESLALGQELYQANCAECHGESGKGNGLRAAGLNARLPNFSDQAFMAQKSAADFFTAISEGLPPEMPAYADELSENERWALADYTRWLSFAPAGQLAAQAASPVAIESEPAQPGETLPEGAGTITGSVINGSSGAPSAGSVVTLHAFDGMQVVYTETTTTQADGSFVFEEVEMPANRVFLATTELGEATYASNITTVSPDNRLLPLNITTYETTSDLSAIVADRLHIFLDFSNPGIVQVIELYIMSNQSNKTLVPEQEGGPVVRFPLPEGAANLQFQDGEIGNRYIETPGGFGDTMAVHPSTGEYQVLFAFELPYDRKLEINQPLNMPVQALIILQPESRIKVKSDQLEEEAPRDIQGIAYQIYSGGPLEAGDTLKLSLSGRPGASRTLLAAGSNDTLIIGLGAFGLVMIVAGVWLYRRNRNGDQQVGEEGEVIEDEVQEQDAESLMDAIIALDDLYQDGELPEEAYRQRRAHLKERLRELEK